VKEFENLLRIDKVIAMSLVYYFLGHSAEMFKIADLQGQVSLSGNGAIRQIAHDFLSVSYCNYVNVFTALRTLRYQDTSVPRHFESGTDTLRDWSRSVRTLNFSPEVSRDSAHYRRPVTLEHKVLRVDKFDATNVYNCYIPMPVVAL